MSTNLDGFRHRMVRVGDVNIHAVIGGEGPPLVLLHGFPQIWWEWHKMMPLLAVGTPWLPSISVAPVTPTAPRMAMTRRPLPRTSTARWRCSASNAMPSADMTSVEVDLVGNDGARPVGDGLVEQRAADDGVPHQDRRGERDLRGLVKTVRRAGRPMRRPRP
jgi:hypothetical protein